MQGRPWSKLRPGVLPVAPLLLHALLKPSEIDFDTFELPPARSKSPTTAGQACRSLFGLAGARSACNRLFCL
jgi:hypothetical protein